MWEDGLILRDPDRGVFEATTTATLAWEDHRKAQTDALVSCQPRLPCEIAATIAALADDDGSPRPFQKSVWERLPDDSHRVIFLLFPATISQVRHMDNLIQDFTQQKYTEGQNISVELVTQDTHHINTCREMITFWNEFQLWSPGVGYNLRMPLQFIREPFCTLRSALFGSVAGTDDDPVIIMRKELRQIITAPQDTEPLTDDGPNENLCDPNKPFYRTHPRWDSYPLSSSDWMTLFSLTNRLTDDQFVALQRELVTMGNTHRATTPGVLERRPIPWKHGRAGEIDGTGIDVWEIVQEIVGSQGHGSHIFGCIDAESVVKGTILIVKPDIYHGTADPENIRLPYLRGFAYARVYAREALRYQRPLFLGEAEIEDLEPTDGWCHRYKRPDWPSHLVDEVVDDNSDSGSG